MKFSMIVTMNSAAFKENDRELSRILRKVADNLQRYAPEPGVGFYLYDIDGKHVGDAKIIK
jgi:hypothetical protein